MGNNMGLNAYFSNLIFALKRVQPKHFKYNLAYKQNKNKFYLIICQAEHKDEIVVIFILCLPINTNQPIFLTNPSHPKQPPANLAHLLPLFGIPKVIYQSTHLSHHHYFI